MKTKYFFLLALFVCLTSSIYAQKDKAIYPKWTESDFLAANTGKDNEYLSDQEKQIVYYMNIARMNPLMFYHVYLKDFLKSGASRTSYVKSLEETLLGMTPIKALHTSKDLFDEAFKHATDMGKTGRKGHNSLQGRNLKQRFETLQKSYNAFGENCDYGNSDALGIVFSLLIDEEVKNLGHRKNILNPVYNTVGVSIQPHKKAEWNCVMDFGEKK